MAKQEKSKFQLNKGIDHGFDISKGSKRKFDLTKDVDEPVVAPVKPTPEPGKKKNNKLLWIILAIIVITLLIWWILQGKSTESKPVIEEETIEEVTIPTENTKEVSSKVEVPAGEDAVEGNTNNNESSNPSEPVANSQETTPVPATSQPTNNEANNNALSVVYNDVEAEALKVIRGDYGVGQDRKKKLGTKYQTIQNRVNELKREGAF